MNQPQPKTVPPDSIPEVVAYLEAKDMLEVFEQRYPDFINNLRTLVEDLNNKIQAAEKAVKARNVFCGPWVKHNQKVEIDVQKLFDVVGRDAFLKMGGVEETKVQHTIAKEKVEIALATGVIPEDKAEGIRTIKVSYTGPKPKAI